MIFSVPIHAGPLSAGNWFVRHNDLSYTILAAQVILDNVILTLDTPAANVGPDVVSYSPPPYDVLSAGGLVPAPAFADYPIT